MSNKLDLTEARDAIEKAILKMQRGMVEAADRDDDPVSSGYYRGHYDAFLAVLDDLPVVHP